MANIPITFDQISIGKKFIIPSGITYQKVSNSEVKPVLDKQGKLIANGFVSTLFNGTKILLTPVS